MDLRDYLAVMRKRWVAITVMTVVAAAAALTAGLLSTPVYTASTQLYVSVQGGTSTNDLLQGSNFTRQQVASYTRLVTSPTVLGGVIDDLGLDMRADVLAERITSDSPVASSLINISVTDESPAVAAVLANSVASRFRDFVSDIEQPVDGSPSGVKLTVVRDAVAPTAPSSPNLRLNVLLGLVAGVVIGVGGAVLRELLDTRVRDEAAVAQVTSRPVVGRIAFDGDAGDHPLIIQSDPHSPRAEAFRTLRTNVQFLSVSDRPRSILVTSSVPGEGKSTTTINLAVALADAGSKVALVDADLRRPAVARYLGLESAVGLTTVLIGRADVADVMQPWGNGMLHVLPSGQVPPNPSELLGSQAMQRLLDKLVADYDVVLVDTPPLLPVTDAAVLSRFVGGTLLVVGLQRVHRGQLEQSLRALETVDADVLGVVLNMEPVRAGPAYAYYRYSETSSRPSGRTAHQRRGRGSRVTPDGDGVGRPATQGAVDRTDAGAAERLPWPSPLSTDGDREPAAAGPAQHQRRAR